MLLTGIYHGLHPLSAFIECVLDRFLVVKGCADFSIDNAVQLRDIRVVWLEVSRGLEALTEDDVGRVDLRIEVFLSRETRWHMACGCPVRIVIREIGYKLLGSGEFGGVCQRGSNKQD